jgi:hypothetical protein
VISPSPIDIKIKQPWQHPPKILSHGRNLTKLRKALIMLLKLKRRQMMMSSMPIVTVICPLHIRAGYGRIQAAAAAVIMAVMSHQHLLQI